jgi:hypothetical protein
MIPVCTVQTPPIAEIRIQGLHEPLKLQKGGMRLVDILPRRFEAAKQAAGSNSISQTRIGIVLEDTMMSSSIERPNIMKLWNECK